MFFSHILSPVLLQQALSHSSRLLIGAIKNTNCASRRFLQMIPTTDREGSLQTILSLPSPIRQRCEIVGRVLESRFQVIRFVRSDQLADVFLVRWLEQSPSMILEAKVYPQNGLCQAVWKAQKRHIKRLCPKTLATVREDGVLFLVLNPKAGEALASTQVLPEFQCDSRVSDTSNGKTQINTSAAQNILATCFNRDIPSHENLVEHLKAVIVTTNHIVLGRDACFLASDTAATFETSRSPEDNLRDARIRLHKHLESVVEDKPTFADCCSKLRSWDSTDTRYRNLLHKFGNIRSYELEMQKIQQDFEWTAFTESLECLRQTEWEEFIASLALGPSHLTTCAFTSTLKLSKRLRLELPGTSSIEEYESDAASFVLSKTEKQRAKRQRRRDRANAQIRADEMNYPCCL